MGEREKKWKGEERGDAPHILAFTLTYKVKTRA